MKTFIVAEMSANHGGSLENALKTVHAVKEAGADALKIQTYTADTITLDCDAEDFVVAAGSLWAGKRLHSLYQEAYTPWEWHKAIFEEAASIGLPCFSSPFDRSAVDLLESLGCPIYKIASPEITDIPLIEYCAKTGKPIIISTGIATDQDIKLALEACYSQGNHDVTLLKCTTAYPAPIEDANLATMADMRERYGVKVGLSDHTLGHDVAAAAVALGACMVEKHFIIDRAMGGPDSAFSMNKEEFAAMVTSIRNIEKAIGTVKYPTEDAPVRGRRYARSLYIAEDVKAGDVLDEKNLRSVRPSFGLHPKYYKYCIGKKVNRDLKKGDRFSLDYID